VQAFTVRTRARIRTAARRTALNVNRPLWCLTQDTQDCIDVGNLDLLPCWQWEAKGVFKEMMTGMLLIRG